MEFKDFAVIVRTQFYNMSNRPLFEVNVDKNELWEVYLKSFPEGTNPLYKERTEHDCVCCRHFIRDVGAVVSIEGNQLVSIWDIRANAMFQPVVDALSELVKSKVIKDVYSHPENTAGDDRTLQRLKSGEVVTWNHFSCVIPKKYVGVTPTTLSDVRSTVQVFRRGMDEITKDSVDIVLELIAQNSLYKGAEFKADVLAFSKLKAAYAKVDGDAGKDILCWDKYQERGARIRGTMIGTLLQDISEGKDLDHAVRSYESKAAPTNYKRPTALITKGMVEKAMSKVKELDIESSLYRRFAVPQDISVNNVLFADRGISTAMKDGLMDSLMGDVKENPKSYSRVEDVSIDAFESLIPNITSMEVLVENKHKGNFMSLIAPKHTDTPNILKWGNNFSWSYNGNVTDSIKERVKSAGGNVTGVLRVSLSWFNIDDLDLHIVEPCGNRIYFSPKRNPLTTGHLDVDMNAGGSRASRTPVENIVWTNKAKMGKGTYEVRVNNFHKRTSSDVGFIVEMEYNGEIKTFHYNKAVNCKETRNTFTFKFDGTKVSNIKVGAGVTSEAISQEVWNVSTGKFQKVSMLTTSPNYWDGNAVGNKHHFFGLDKCVNPERPRGFYNEFLRSDLEPYRKVFEVLGEKTKCEESDDQISGIGFSSTKRDSVVCRVAGKFNRTLRVNF